MDSPRVLIIVLNWNGGDDTLACLASLAQLDYPAVAVLVVDNGSTDASVAAIRAAHPWVRLIETGTNLGYAGGNNVGLRDALGQGFDYALLLNNDTEVAPDFLTQLVAVCEQDATVGAAGPKIYLHDRLTTLWSAGGVIGWRDGGRTMMRGLNQPDMGQFDVLQEIDYAPGCAVLVRRQALLDAGLLDERFGMYYEETEWCVRIRRAGWRIVYVPTSRVWHKVRLDRQDWSPAITYYMARNRLLFLRLTRASFTTWLQAAVFQDLRTWLSWRLRPKWRGRAAQRRALCHAWGDFLRGRFGMTGAVKSRFRPRRG